LSQRFLFVVPPLVGHVNPTVSVGRELQARGHRVAWAGHRDAVADVLPAGAELLPVGDAVPPELRHTIEARARGARGFAALKLLWEGFQLPLARSMLSGVFEAVDTFRPDVLIVDQQALAGAAVARVQHLRWATSATTSAELTDPLASMPKVDGWVRDELRRFQLDAGVAPALAELDPRFSEHLVLAFTTPALVGPGPFPVSYAFVGPSMTDRPESIDFDWSWLDDSRPLVLVSLGTLNAEIGGRFLGAVCEAVADLAVQAIVVAPPELIPTPPANVLLRERVPQLALLGHTAAVISHGGHNTVCESLAHGVPLVVAPIRDDQPIIAEQVERAGAGRRVKFGRARPDDITSALCAVLTDDRYRDAADAVRRSFEAAGGPHAAADRLEALSRTPAGARRRAS
jgi:MGT family glycosyltransferase